MKPFRFMSLFDKSMPVGAISGIPIRLHITILFFLLPALLSTGFNFWFSLEYAVGIVLSILIHELGHALVAKRFRMSGLSITLHGFGGFATSSGYRTPRQQLIIVLAGPGATFALGLLLIAIGRLGSGGGHQFALLFVLGMVNIQLGFLNLVPILPWDGGMALQAILAHRFSEFKAMRYAAHVGLVLAAVELVTGYATGQRFFSLFAIIGLMTCYSMLANSGGIRFGEAFADRKRVKDLEAVRKREEAKTQEFLGDVNRREKEREERERLRKLFEASLIDDEPPKP